MPERVKVQSEVMDEIVDEEIDVDDSAPVVMIRHRTTSSSETERQHAFAALQVVGGTVSRPPKASPSSSMSSDHQSDSAGSVPLSVKTSSEGSNFQIPRESPVEKIVPEGLLQPGPVVWERLLSEESGDTHITPLPTNIVNLDAIPFADPEDFFDEELISGRRKEQFLMEDADKGHWDRMQHRGCEGGVDCESPPVELESNNHLGAWSRRWAQETHDNPIVGVPKPAPTLPDFNEVLRFHRIDSAQVLMMDSQKAPKILGHYLFGGILGEGSYGKVKECLDTDTLCRRAVKIMKNDKIRKIPNGFEHVKFEIKLLRRMRHENVIRMFEVMRNEKKGKLYLIMEYCICSLQGMLDAAPQHRVELWQSQNYFMMLINGLQYLHGMGIVHKDIKPGNLLLTPSEQLKITDFGTSHLLNAHLLSDIVEQGTGTPKFQPPEIAGAKDGSPLRGFPVDLWACGVTLYNMVSGKHPFEGSNEFLVYKNISTLPVELPECIKFEDALGVLIMGLLQKDPNRRYTIRQVRQCDWFRRRQPRTLKKVALPCGMDNSMTTYPCLEQMYGSQIHSPVGSHPSNELLAAPSGGFAQRKLTTGSQFEGDALTFSVGGFANQLSEAGCSVPRRNESDTRMHSDTQNITSLLEAERTLTCNSAGSSTNKLSNSGHKRVKFCKQQ